MMDTHSKLAHAVTQYDIRQSKKRGYNIYALAHYLGAVQETCREIEAGKSIRSALVGNFNGRLLDVCLKAVGEPTSTKEEQRGW
jgi:hypothetical protein